MDKHTHIHLLKWGREGMANSNTPSLILKRGEASRLWGTEPKFTLCFNQVSEFFISDVCTN